MYEIGAEQYPNPSVEVILIVFCNFPTGGKCAALISVFRLKISPQGRKRHHKGENVRGETTKSALFMFPA